MFFLNVEIKLFQTIATQNKCKQKGESGPINHAIEQINGVNGRNFQVNAYIISKYRIRSSR